MTEPRFVRELLPTIPQAVLDGFGRTGAAVPPALEGCTVLDLGCKTGREAFLAARLVGETGRVISIDASADAIATASECAKNIDRLSFAVGDLRDLGACGIEPGSVDVVISNCGIFDDSCPKPIFEEIWKALKVGGELYFTEVFANRRVEAEVREDADALANGLANAVYQEDFRRMMNKVGWIDFRCMNSVRVSVDAALEEKLNETQYAVRTIRAFKLPDYMEDICEQYGQWATYEGGIPGMNQYFDLDDHHRFFLDVPMSVCGNSCCYVQDTRYGKFFRIEGDRTHHVGPFSGCGKAPEPREAGPQFAVAKCC